MKNSNMKNVHYPDVVISNSKLSLPKFKIALLAGSITTLICSSVTSYSADLEIYKIPEDSVGATTLMMMLDLSGSMDTRSIRGDYDSGNDSNVCSGGLKTDSTETMGGRLRVTK